MNIRPESHDDYAGIRRLHTEAFEGEAEARLVDGLRAAGGLAVSLVAEEGGRVIGHIALSPMQRTGEEPLALGLAPMAVRPERQKQGIGSALVHEAIVAAREAGAHAIFVLGHADYYPRFGFAPAQGLRCAYDAPPEAFMVLELVPGGLDAYSGVVHYHEVFETGGS